MNRTEAQLPLSKRLLAAFFSLVLVVGLMPVTAWAESEGEQGGDNQEQTEGSNTGSPVDENSDQGEGSGAGNGSSDQNGDEGTDENGIQVASDNDPEIVATNGAEPDIKYDKKDNPLTQEGIYQVLVDKFGKPGVGGFTLSWSKAGSKPVEHVLDSSSSGKFTPDQYGELTYTVYYHQGSKSHMEELTIQEIVEITNNPKDTTYNAEAHKWEPTVKGKASSTLTAGKDYTVTYKRGDVVTDDFTSAGTITVEIKGLDNYSYINEAKSYTIQQKSVTVTAKKKSKTYGEPDPDFEAKVSGLKDGDSIEYTVSRSNTDVNDAGDYEGVIVPTGDTSQGNYTVTYKSADFTIKQANKLTLDVSEAGYEDAYDGQEHGGVAVTNDPYGTATIEYSTDGITWSSTAPKVKDASEVSVQVRASSKNYKNQPKDATYKLVVNPADVTVSVKGNSDTVTYNGEEQHVTGFTATASSELYNVGNVVPNAGVNTIAKGTGAGTYKMGLTAGSFYNTDDNFNVTWGSVEDGVLTIDAADVTVNVKGNTKTVTYNGEKQQVTGFTATTDSDLYDTSNVVLNPDFSDTAVGTDAATYMMGLGADSFYNADDNFNVNWNFQGDGGITIEKRAIQVSDSASVVYNGQEQVLNFTASKVTGLVDGDRLNLFGAQVKGTEPGTYTDVTVDRWEVVNDELNVTNNYDLTLNGELTITKADDSATNNGGSSADNGTKASGSDNGSTTTKTADTALPFGVAFAAAAAALAALVATRKLRSMR